MSTLITQATLPYFSGKATYESFLVQTSPQTQSKNGHGDRAGAKN
jgi:hypothetical protein